MNVMKRLLIIYLLLGCAPTHAGQFQVTYTESGRVVDVEGRGIPEATITVNVVCSPVGFPPRHLSGTGVTDAEGRYSVTIDLGAGTCGLSVSVAVSKPGYVFTSNYVGNEGFVGVTLPQFLSVSAADYRQMAASETIASGFAENLATQTETALAVPLPSTLAGRSVTVTDRTGLEKVAELFFVAPAQINYLIPAGLSEGSAVVKVREGGRLVRAGIIAIGRIAPSIFTLTADGKGIPAAFLLRVKADNSSVYEPIARFDAATNQHAPLPIDLGPETDQVILGLLGTGWRHRDPSKVVSAKIGGLPVEVLYAGLQPTLPGVDQINLAIPRSLLGRGEVDVAVTFAGETGSPQTNTVKITVK